MVLERRSSLNIENGNEQYDNLSLPGILTPTGRNHFYRQCSQENFGKSIEIFSFYVKIFDDTQVVFHIDGHSF